MCDAWARGHRIGPTSTEVAAVSATTGRRRVYGVDFSGAQDAGANCWIASATRRADTLFVEGCFPASELPGSAREREACLPALREFVAAADDGVVGMDFPFGLPAELVDADSWTAFVDAFPGGAADPESWADSCRDLAEPLDRDRVELKRATDEEAGAPFSPYNLRMRSGTYYGLAEVLRPLVAREAVSVLPMQTPNPGLPWLVEACPAVTLDGLDADATGYKDADGGEAVREVIVDALTEADALRDRSITLPASVRETAIETADGDALDAVVAALGVARALERGDPFAPGTVDPRTRIEGRIYG